MNRKEFIESHGATCRNWRWSWAFVNHDKEKIIFGAWDINEDGDAKKILDEEWQQNRLTGRKAPGYAEALEYVALVERQGYALQTFPMHHVPADPADPLGPAKIKQFKPNLSDARLVRDGSVWRALPLLGSLNERLR